MSINNQKNECKLMILYMLKNLSFPLTHENLSNFFLDKYASYIKFQQILAELIDTKLIEEHKTKVTVCYKITEDGTEALEAFINEITDERKHEIDEYIKINKIKLKEESMIKANYTDGQNCNFRINLEINENKDEIFRIEIDVPTSDAATTICENWKDKAKNIYSYIIKQLL